MSNNSNKPFIRVKESASNFAMIDCEYYPGKSERPLLTTEGENTRIFGLKIFRSLKKRINRKWLWYGLIPFFVTVIGGIVVLWIASVLDLE